MSNCITTRRPAPARLALALVASAAGVGVPATAADTTRRARDRSAEHAVERAQAASAAAAASAASAPASAASAPVLRAAAVAPFAPPRAWAASAPASGASSPQTTVSLTIGPAWKAKAHEHVLTTPFVLGIDHGDHLHGELNGDGYTRNGGTSRSHGLGDVSALGSYTFVLNPAQTVSATPTFQWTFPAGGAVGSKRSSQELSVKLMQQFHERWYVSVEPFLDRDTEDAARSTEYGRKVDLALKWKKNDDVATVFTLERARPAGERDRTKLSAEHDFNICRKLDGALVLARSLAGGDSASSAELDLIWNF